MMTTTRVTLLLTLLAVLPAVGCESPESRIEDNQALFNTYPPETQTLIRAGQIAIGFDRAQVEMALGRPDSHAGGDGVEEWLWTRVEHRTIEVEKDVSQYARERDEADRQRAKGEDVAEPSLTYPVREQRTRVERVVRFRDGRVTGFEEPSAAYLDEWWPVPPSR
jgi:hypothetical protein